MTTGRINQVAILGHTGSPRAACSDSTLSARLRGRAPPAGLPDLKRTKGARGAMEGPRRSRATARPLTGAGQPSTGWGAIVRHRVPAAAKGVAGHAPPHRVPLQRNPPTLGQTARCKLPHGSTPLTWDTSGQKNVGGRVEIRGTPEAGSIPRTRLRLPCQRADGPRRFRRRPHRLACNVPRSGRREARRTPRTRLHRLVPSTAPSRATHRTAGDEPVGSVVARFRLGTHGFETLRIDTSRT